MDVMTIAVIGVGTMGRGIAYAAASTITRSTKLLRRKRSGSRENGMKQR